MALLRRGQKTAPAATKRKEKAKPKPKPKATAPLAKTSDAERAALILDEIRWTFSEPEEDVALLLGAKFQLTDEEALKQVRSGRRKLRRHGLESLKTAREDLFGRALARSERAHREKRWDDARAEDRFIADQVGAVAPKKAVIGVASLGTEAIDPQIAGLLGVMNAEEVESIIAEGKEVGDDG